MKPFRSTIIAFLALLAVSASANIVFDQGPGTGTSTGTWVNQTLSQNFADLVSFGSDTSVDGLNYFTDHNLSAHNGSSDFHLKILSDSSGAPGSVLFSADLGYSSSYTEGGYNAYHFDFAPYVFLGGVDYWVGISGNGFEAAQLGLLNVAGGNSSMAQFSGALFQNFTDAYVGDQAFQLTSSGGGGQGVADSGATGALAALGLSILAMIKSRKR